MTDIKVQRINAGKGHYYKIDGEKADGVTTLIGNGVPKPALINWAANATAEYAVDNWSELAEKSPSVRLKELQKSRYAVSDSAARRGTEVHGLAEDLLHGREVDVPEEIAGHVESYVKFLDEWKPEPIMTEKTVYHTKWRYCGTADMVVKLPDGQVLIADIKTSRSGIYGETALQLAAYRYAEAYADGDEHVAMGSLNITGGLGIWVRSDGYDVLPIECGEQQFKNFLHAAWVARWAKTSRDLVGAAIRPVVA